MRNIQLDKPSLDKDWSMCFMDENHYDIIYDEDVKIVSPTGQPIAVLLKKALDPQKASNAWAFFRKSFRKTGNRATAAGISKLKDDGSDSFFSVVPKGWAVDSAILGSVERTVRYPFARHCAINKDNKNEFSRTFPLLEQAANFFQNHVQERFEIQKEYCNKTDPAWLIPNTVYTTLTLNRNFRTSAHKDAGDLEAGFSNMFIISQGKWSGANLVLPNWRVAFKLDHLDLILFDAHEFHGNTSLVKISKDAVRCSVVCYYREKLVLCGSPKEELELVKKRKPGDPLFSEVKSVE